MCTFHLFTTVCIFLGILSALFVQIQTKPMELEKEERNETFNTTTDGYNITSPAELTALATTSDLNMTSSYMTSSGNSTEEDLNGSGDPDVEEMLKASPDDDMFSIIIDQSGSGDNSTESLEDETLISDESGSGESGEDATAMTILTDDLDDLSVNSTVGNNGNGTEAWATDSIGSPIQSLMFA